MPIMKFQMSDSDSDAESQSGPHFCPMPYRYGVLRVDAVETVKHLNDPVATAQAAALQTKEYLVYLDEVNIERRLHTLSHR